MEKDQLANITRTIVVALGKEEMRDRILNAGCQAIIADPIGSLESAGVEVFALGVELGAQTACEILLGELERRGMTIPHFDRPLDLTAN